MTSDRPGTRRLILHADDFGMNRDVTDGILHGFLHGLLTSTAVIANAPDTERALTAWRRLAGEFESGRHPSAAARDRQEPRHRPFDFGIHLNLTQGAPLTGDRYPPELCDREGRFGNVGRLYRTLLRHGSRYERAVFRELSAQVEFLLDRGFAPTHANGHQYVELMPGVRGAVIAVVEKYGLPCLRISRESGLWRTVAFHRGNFSNWCLSHVKRFYANEFRRQTAGLSVASPDAYFGTSHAGRIELALVRLFLKRKDFSVAEIGLHPGRPSTAIDPALAKTGWSDPLMELRPRELELLCSDGLARLLAAENVQLGRLSELTPPVRLRAA